MSNTNVVIIYQINNIEKYIKNITPSFRLRWNQSKKKCSTCNGILIKHDYRTIQSFYPFSSVRSLFSKLGRSFHSFSWFLRLLHYSTGTKHERWHRFRFLLTRNFHQRPVLGFQSDYILEHDIFCYYYNIYTDIGTVYNNEIHTLTKHLPVPN